MIRLHRAGPLRVLGLAGLAAASLAAAAVAEPSAYPTGVTRYDPAQAYNGFVLFAGPDQKTHLIDMDGHEVHTWDHQGFPSVLLDPALAGGDKGHVLVQLEAGASKGTGAVPGAAIFDNKTIGELDWSGKTVWSWGEQAPGGAARQHHDLRRLPDGNTLVLVNVLHPVAGFSLPQILDDAIYEVTPKGEIVWRWLASDHLDEFGFTPEQLALVKASGSPDYLHLNDMAPLGANHWAEAGDVRFAADNIIVDSRNANFVIIIDKKTGKVVWRLGPNFAPGETLPTAGGGAPKFPHPVEQISGQHDAHMIPEGLPGAGDILLFDNEGPAGYPPAALGVNAGSRVLEIDPPTQAVVWQYSAEDSGSAGWTFYSSFISSARRLPNGNTLIDEGMNGRIFQVTPDHRIVWEYVSPYVAKAPIGGFGREVTSNWIYRAQPVPYAWVPDGTPHAETPVSSPDPAGFHVPGAP
ncbi:MAG: aryl-sulfate sulfotransferase [Caulobacteraceae bacterium]|nr:aryl-sulfate sulfotransferase [Caulobacteraceae bacterium]